METYLLEHLTDLSDRAEQKGVYTFSGFLTPEEQSALLERKRNLTTFSLFGGADGTERNMARFGNEAAIGYTQDFPIVCLKLSPLHPKFAEKLTHRDYLGSVMALGIDRSGIGDIVVRDTDAYLFCTEKISAYLTENLCRIRNTDISVTVCDTLPEGSLFQTELMRFTLSSLRIDCAAGAAVKLSRGHVLDLFREKKVFLNGSLCEKPDAQLEPGDTFSVRGFGKFRFRTVTGTSKKGKLVTEIEKYV